MYVIICIPLILIGIIPNSRGRRTSLDGPTERASIFADTHHSCLHVMHVVTHSCLLAVHVVALGSF